MENEVNNYSLTIEEFKEMWDRAKEKSKGLNINYNIVVDINNNEINADDYLIQYINGEYLVYIFYKGYCIANIYLKYIKLIYWFIFNFKMS